MLNENISITVMTVGFHEMTSGQSLYNHNIYTYTNQYLGVTTPIFNCMINVDYLIIKYY